LTPKKFSKNLTGQGIKMIDIIFLILAILFSVFYGVFWKQIWVMPLSPGLTKSRLLHEVWFNFIGSLTGWICLYIIYKSLSAFTWQTVVINISWQHIFLFIIALTGITGLLPYILWSISRVVDQIIGKILKK